MPISATPLIADRPLLAMPIRYALCVSKKQYRATLKRMGLRDPGDDWVTSGKGATTHLWHVDEEGGPAAVVCIGGWKGRAMSQIAGLLVHEAVHVWQETRDRMGEHRPSSEFEAYAVQGIAQELIEMFEQAMGWS